MTDTAAVESTPAPDTSAPAPSVSSSDTSPTPSRAPASDQALDLDSDPVDLDAPKPVRRQLVRKDAADTPEIRERKAKTEQDDIARTRDRALDRHRRQQHEQRPQQQDPRQQRPDLQNMQRALREQFADIRSVEDVNRLQQTDPARYARLDAARQQLEQAAEQQQDPTRTDEREEAQRRSKRDPDLPRSWSNEDGEVFKLLPPAVRKSISEKEALRERHFLQARESARQGIETIQRTQQETQQAASQLVRDALFTLVPEMQEFEFLKSAEDVARLHLESPEAAARFEALKSRAAEIKSRADAFQAGQREHQVKQLRAAQMAQAQQFQEYQRAHAQEFSKRYPNVTTEDEKAIIEGLTQHYELTPQDIARLAQLPQMSSWQGRAILHDALAWRRAQAKFKDTVRPVQPARAQMPGMAASRSSFDDVASAANRGDMATFFKLREKGKSTQLQGAPRQPRQR